MTDSINDQARSSAHLGTIHSLLDTCVTRPIGMVDHGHIELGLFAIVELAMDLVTFDRVERDEPTRRIGVDLVEERSRGAEREGCEEMMGKMVVEAYEGKTVDGRQSVTGSLTHFHPSRLTYCFFQRSVVLSMLSRTYGSPRK